MSLNRDPSREGLLKLSKSSNSILTHSSGSIILMEMGMKCLTVKLMDKTASGELLIRNAIAAKHWIVKKRSVIKFWKGEVKEHSAYNWGHPLNHSHHCYKDQLLGDICRISANTWRIHISRKFIMWGFYGIPNRNRND